MNGLEHIIWKRHGQSAHNNLNRRVLSLEAPDAEAAYLELLHHHDTVADDSVWPLTELGRSQARFASGPIQAYVAPLRPAVFITSGFERADHTGLEVFPDAPWQKDSRVAERNWGKTTHGITCVHAYREAHAKMLAGAETDPHFIPGHLGESVYSRVLGLQDLFTELGQQYPGGTAVISSHGEMSKMARWALAGGDPLLWPAICLATGMGNLMFLHFKRGPSGNLDLVNRFNPLAHPMEETGWQPVDASHLST
ncbi:hypothetical protein BH11PAT4_BH11PAT4_1410 [soil metagenome]